jgi:hypothetical protein
MLIIIRGELSYLAPLGSEKISAPYFKKLLSWGGGVLFDRVDVFMADIIFTLLSLLMFINEMQIPI